MHVEFAIKALSQAHDKNGKVFDSAEYLNDIRAAIIGCILLSPKEGGPELTYCGACGNNKTLLTWRACFNDDFTLEQVWSSLSFGLPINCELLWIKKIVARNCFGNLTLNRWAHSVKLAMPFHFALGNFEQPEGPGFFSGRNQGVPWHESTRPDRHFTAPF